MLLIADRNQLAVDRSRPADALDQRRLSGWILLLALASFAALAAPFFLGRVYVADDLGEFHLPLKDFYARQLLAGEPFDWMPTLFGGFYVTGEGQIGAYHPLHWLLYRCLPLGAAFDLEILLSYPLMFAGMYFFLAKWLVRRDAALFGALAFTFCGFNLLHLMHPNAVAIVAHVPWLLLAIEIVLTEPSGPRRATAELAVGLLTASQLLVGYPQYVWFSLLTEASYTAWRVMALRISAARLGMLALAVALGVAAAGIQLLPTMEALADSTRSESDSAFADAGSLHPLNIVQLVAPYLFRTRVVGQNTHELGFYAGGVPLLLCAWLLSQRQRWGRHAALVRATIVFGGLATLLALGQSGGLYWLQSLVPFANQFRFPCRAIVLVQLAIAVGAATAFAILREADGEDDAAHRRRGNRTLAGLLAASIFLALIGPIVWPEHVAATILVWCGPLVIGAGAGLLALAERRRQWAWMALVALTAVDSSVYGLSYSVWNRTAVLQEFVAGIVLPPGKAPVRVAVEDDGRLRVGDRMLLAGLQRVDGYAGLEPRKRLDYSKASTLRVAGAHYLFQSTPAGGKSKSRWVPLDSPAPRVRLVSRTVPFEPSRGVDAADFDTAAVNEPLALVASAPGTTRVLVDRPGEMVVECQTPARQLLVTTESFHRGWRGWVDERMEPVVRVNGDFLGCVVEARNHRVRLVFQPVSLFWGACLSAGGLGLLLFTFATSLRRRMSG
jgi:hypothetical protein